MNFTIIYNLVLLIIIFIILSIFIYNLYVENFENSFSDNSSSNVSDILNEDEELQLLNSANDNPFVLDIDYDPYKYEESHNNIDGFQSKNNSSFNFFSVINDFFDTFYKNIIAAGPTAFRALKTSLTEGQYAVMKPEEFDEIAKTLYKQWWNNSSGIRVIRPDKVQFDMISKVDDTAGSTVAKSKQALYEMNAKPRNVYESHRNVQEFRRKVYDFLGFPSFFF